MSSHISNPFKGLQSYGPYDGAKLFGRDRDLILMKDRIFSARATLLFAGSGVGKTSFLNAKIIPDLQSQYTIFYHNRWTGADKPLEAVKKTLSEKIKNAENTDRLIDCFQDFCRRPNSQDSGDTDQDTTAPEQCLLIFDQFEEIFQYHAYEDYFKRFLNELCEVVRREEYRVHIILSMREEYLGELSVFDNQIPDPFNNYYRLKYPHKRDAAQIIAGTCRLAGAKVHEQNLKELIRDLSKIEKGLANATERSTQGHNGGGHVVERDFVIPPYLQIVCHRQWQNEVAVIRGNEIHQFTFLENYQPNQAQKTLRDYCHEKLSALSFMEQNVAEKSFDYLVTKQGAKMAYEFSSLVDHMRLRFSRSKLRAALNKLSSPETRILRKSHGPDGSLWFELYHDIYGRILDTWRESFRRRKRRTAISLGIGLLFILFILIPIALHWLVRPYGYINTLKAARLENSEHFVNATSAFRDLSNTFGYGRYANSLWAQAWKNRAEYAERHNKRDEAIVSWLTALRFEPNGASSDGWRLKVGNLVRNDFQMLRHTLHHDDEVVSAAFSDDSRLIATKTIDGRIWVWDGQTGALIGKHSNSDPPPIAEAIAGVNETRRDLSSRPASEKDRTKPVIQQGKPDLGTSEKYQIEAAAHNEELGWLVAVTDEEGPTNARDFYMGYNGSTAKYYTIPVAILSGGSELLTSPIAAEIRITAGSIDTYKVAISPNGEFLATTGRGQLPRVWRLAEGKILLPEDFRIPGLVTDVWFSQDGRSLLLRGDQDRLFMLDLTSGELRYPPISAFKVRGCEFKSSSDRFVCFSDDPVSDLTVARLWDSETGEPIGDPIPAEGGGDLAITNDDKILQLDTNTQSVRLADIQKGKFQEPNRFDLGEYTSLRFSHDGSLGLTYKGNQVRLFHLDYRLPVETMTNEGDTIAEAVLSEDGTRVITLINHPPKVESTSSISVQVHDAKTLAPLGSPIQDVIVLSDNGEYVARLLQDKDPVQKSKAPHNQDAPQIIQILNVSTGAEVMRFSYPDGMSFNRLVSSANGKFFATYRARARERSRYEEYLLFLGHEYSADPGRALTANAELYLWSSDNSSGPISSMMEIQNFQQISIVFSKDEKFFAVSASSSPGIVLWDLQKKQSIVLQKNLPGAGTLSLSNQGYLIAGAGQKVRVWDLTTQRPVFIDLDTLERIDTVAMSSDGKTVLTGNVNGIVSRWTFSPNTLPNRVGDEIKYFDPYRFVRFSDDGRTGIIVAGHWLHTLDILENRYTASYFLGKTWLQQCRNINGSADEFRCLFQTQNNLLKVRELQSDKILDTVPVSDDASNLLETWTKRLGVTINNLGNIKPLEFEPSAAPR